MWLCMWASFSSSSSSNSSTLNCLSKIEKPTFGVSKIFQQAYYPSIHPSIHPTCRSFVRSPVCSLAGSFIRSCQSGWRLVRWLLPPPPPPPCVANVGPNSSDTKRAESGLQAVNKVRCSRCKAAFRAAIQSTLLWSYRNSHWLLLLLHCRCTTTRASLSVLCLSG